jgi:hypothetical protein
MLEAAVKKNDSLYVRCLCYHWKIRHWPKNKYTKSQQRNENWLLAAGAFDCLSASTATRFVFEKID